MNGTAADHVRECMATNACPPADPVTIIVIIIVVIGTLAFAAVKFTGWLAARQMRHYLEVDRVDEDDQDQGRE